MIIDRLAKESAWLRAFADRSRVVQAPFAVFPPRESRLEGKTALVPREGQNISGQFAKPPYTSLVVIGNGDEGREQGALFVQSSPIESVEQRVLDLAPPDATHVLLVTVGGFTDRFTCLVAYRFLVFCGEYFSAPPNIAFVTEMSKQAFLQINGFPPEQAGAEFQILEEDWDGFIQHQVSALAALFALMSCRNVLRTRLAPDERLQRSRKRSGKHPLYAYSTLMVKPMGRRNGNANGNGNGNGNGGADLHSIHWVKGHFKEYTPERPLFGKLAGLFWWEPHLVGAAAD